MKYNLNIMTKIISKIDINSEEFKKNEQCMLNKIFKLKKIIKKINLGGSEKNRNKHIKRGKLLPRTRLKYLLDYDSPFLELSQLAAYKVYKDYLPSAGIITGIGKIMNTECMIIMNDSTVKGGVYYPLTVKKHLRAQEISKENNLPCIYIVDSGGAYLPLQDEIFPDINHFGRIFYNQAYMSSKKIPQISIVMGTCVAGGAYIPVMSDESIMVKNKSNICLGGPILLKTATGENTNIEDLGGANLHCRYSGISDHYAYDEKHALYIARNIIKHLNRKKINIINRIKSYEPLYDAKELNGIIPENIYEPFDIKEIIARIVDRSEFHEFRKLYGSTLICGFSHIFGYPIGIIGNNGILFNESVLKGTNFIELCTNRGIPILFLQNTTGFIIGKEYERDGIAKNGAKMILAVANSNVPKFTIIVRSSFGAGNYAMCGRAYNPRFLWSWPSSCISIMGGKQAAYVLSELYEKKYREADKNWSSKNKENFLKKIQLQYKNQGEIYYSSARLWDDGVILPEDTRIIIGLSISASLNAKYNKTNFGIFRM